MSDPILLETLAAIERDMSGAAGQLFVAMIERYLAGASAGRGPVTPWLTPADVQDRFVEPLPVGRRSLEDIAARLEREVLPGIVQLAHPLYMAVNVAPPLPAALWSEALIAALNQSVRVFAMSPTITPIEHQVVRWLAERVGYGAEAGGTLTSGGTEANFTALLAARAAVAPDAWDDGLGASPPIVLCGENAHYSVIRAVAQLGLGRRRAVRVPLRDHRMDPAALARHLEDAAARGTPVMAVVATVGAFGTGAFDDVDAIGQLCEAHGVWLHVDGAHGATALLSERHRARLRGIERAQSVTWDAHKMMLMPLSASAVLVRDAEALDRAFPSESTLPKHASHWNLGLRSFMASRRADALKMWVALQRYGADGIGALYDHLCTLASELHDLLSARPDFVPLHAPDCNLVCFQYVGEGDLPPEVIDQVNRKLFDELCREARSFVATVSLDGRFALRATLMNPLTREAHLHELLEEVAALGRRIVAQLRA